MIFISERIILKPITRYNYHKLYPLMRAIYPPAYSHFWKDFGNWYMESQYSKDQILKELLTKNADYYYIIYDYEIIGNFRILWNLSLGDMTTKKSVKLHRLYIHPKVQSQGIGKRLLEWLEEKAKLKHYELLWLDTMNAQPQAFEFYKKNGYDYYSHCELNFPLMHHSFRVMSQVFKILK